MKTRGIWRGFIDYIKKDTWDSWLVSLALIFVFIKFIFFPFLSLVTGSPLSLVVVESCSMYHETNFDDWWFKNSAWYEQKDIAKEDFIQYPLKNGLNKGDIIFIWGRGEYKKGDIIIFNAPTQYPLIHRIISDNEISTKGDHNPGQLSIENEISKDEIIGKAAARIPILGWLKLIFFEPFKPTDQRGFCT